MKNKLLLLSLGLIFIACSKEKDGQAIIPEPQNTQKNADEVVTDNRKNYPTEQVIDLEFNITASAQGRICKFQQTFRTNIELCQAFDSGLIDRHLKFCSSERLRKDLQKNYNLFCDTSSLEYRGESSKADQLKKQISLRLSQTEEKFTYYFHTPHCFINNQVENFDQYCEVIQDSQLNNYCAIDLRKENFINRNCPGTFEEKNKFVFDEHEKFIIDEPNKLSIKVLEVIDTSENLYRVDLKNSNEEVTAFLTLNCAEGNFVLDNQGFITELAFPHTRNNGNAHRARNKKLCRDLNTQLLGVLKGINNSNFAGLMFVDQSLLDAALVRYNRHGDVASFNLIEL